MVLINQSSEIRQLTRMELHADDVLLESEYVENGASFLMCFSEIEYSLFIEVSDGCRLFVSFCR